MNTKFPVVIDLVIRRGLHEWKFPGLHFICNKMGVELPFDARSGHPEVSMHLDQDVLGLTIKYLVDRRRLYFNKTWSLYLPGSIWTTMVPEPTRKGHQRLGRSWSCLIRQR